MVLVGDAEQVVEPIHPVFASIFEVSLIQFEGRAACPDHIKARTSTRGGRRVLWHVDLNGNPDLCYAVSDDGGHPTRRPTPDVSGYESGRKDVGSGTLFKK